MKRITIVIFFLIAVTFAANAQFFRYGLKGGVSSSNVKMDNQTLNNITTTSGVSNFLIEQGSSKLGLHFGLFARIQIVGLYVQPELLFTQSRGEVILTDVTNTSAPIASLREQKFNKFDIPVMVGWKIGPARIGLGPVASIMLSESDGLKDKFAQLTGNPVESNFNNATFGYQIGAGLDIFKFATIDFKYEGNLSKLGSGITIAGQERKFDQRNPQWILSLGIFL